jgi:hypothetical protein
MNGINERINKAIETRDFTHLDRVQFAYMDGYPTDLPPRTSSKCQVLAAVFGAERSLTLRSPHDSTMLLNDRKIIQWKESDDSYKTSFSKALQSGNLCEPIKAFILVYQPSCIHEFEQALWIKHFGPNGEPTSEFVESYTGQDGRPMLRSKRCLDDRDLTNPKPICISRDHFTIMLLWAEFIIKIYNDVAVDVYDSCNEHMEGLAIFSGLISGDSEENGDRFARVLRALLNGAHQGKITFVNYSRAGRNTHVGDHFADNIAGCIGKQLRETGKPFIDEDKSKMIFKYFMVNTWAEFVPWPHYRRVNCG